MKLSVSLTEADVAFLDSYAAEQGVGSRSAAVQRAVALLRAASLETAYELALEEWTPPPGPPADLPLAPAQAPDAPASVDEAAG